MKVKKTAFGYKIGFDCPKCKSGLVAKLEEAGSIDQCPDCSTRFKVPGEKQLAALRSKEKEALAKREEIKRIKAEEKSAQKAERKAEKERIKNEITNSGIRAISGQSQSKSEPSKELSDFVGEMEYHPNAQGDTHAPETSVFAAPPDASAFATSNEKKDVNEGGDPDRFDKLMDAYSTATEKKKAAYPKPPKKNTVSCQQCGSPMYQGTKASKNYNAQLAGCGVFVLGIFLLLFLPFFPFPQIIGVILMILAARMGYSEKNVWACDNCGYFFERL